MSTTTTNTKARGRVRVETGSKRVRTYLGGEVVADTTTPLLVWERPYYPTYYFPIADVRGALLEAGDDAVAARRAVETGAGSRSGRAASSRGRRRAARALADRRAT